MQVGILVVNDYKLEQNSSVINAKFNYLTEANKDSVLNGNVISFSTCNALRAFLCIKVSTNKKSPDYSIVLVKTVVDVEKFFKGIYANPIVRNVAENLLQALEFDLVFPFKAVRL